MIKAINLNGTITVGVPKDWVRPQDPENTVFGYYKWKDSEHFADGWKEYTVPPYDRLTHKIAGDPIEHDTYFEANIELKSPEEIRAELLQNSEVNKQEKVRVQSDAIALLELMNETDVERVLGNMDVYPVWDVDLPVKNKTDSTNGIPDRLKHFNANNELTLYEVVLSHTTQADWQPKDTPAMFKVVSPEGVIPKWIPPTGAHDAYDIDDEVKYEGFVWTSLINGNTTEPNDFAVTMGWWSKGEAV